MPHPVIESPAFAIEPLFLSDEGGAPLLVPLVQSTYAILAADRLERLPEQPPPSLTGELWGEDAGRSSYRIEPATAFTKPGTDVVLLGHAQARGGPHRELTVTFRVGPVGKQVRVRGDRTWVQAMGAIRATEPLPFERMPLCYERAFGGWDRSARDPAEHSFEPRNPVGTGYRAAQSPFEEGLRLPNLEDPGDGMSRLGQVIQPAAFGFVSPDWQPRLALAGTFDEAWQRGRMPLLPLDFNRRFFNAASPGLISAAPLRGDEPVLIENASARGKLAFNLPGLRMPPCRVELAHGPPVDIALRLDTVIIDTDSHRVLLLHRGHLALRSGPHDVRAIRLPPKSALKPLQKSGRSAMGVTVGVNGMSVVHVGSGGVSIAPLDPCKMQAGPAVIVVPLPNIAKAADLVKGTKKVKCDAQSVAIDGCAFGTSSGDEAGSLGGVVSGKTKGKAEFVNFSFDVKFEGKPVARALDPMLHNDKNTPPAPVLQGPLLVVAAPIDVKRVCVICDKEY